MIQWDLAANMVILRDHIYIYEVFIESKNREFVGHSWGHLAQRLLLDGIMQFHGFFS